MMTMMLLLLRLSLFVYTLSKTKPLSYILILIITSGKYTLVSLLDLLMAKTSELK